MGHQCCPSLLCGQCFHGIQEGKSASNIRRKRLVVTSVGQARLRAQVLVKASCGASLCEHPSQWGDTAARIMFGLRCEKVVTRAPNHRPRRGGASGNSSSFFWGPQSFSTILFVSTSSATMFPGLACTGNANCPNDVQINNSMSRPSGTVSKLRQENTRQDLIQLNVVFLHPRVTPPRRAMNNHSAASACPALNLHPANHNNLTNHKGHRSPSYAKTQLRIHLPRLNTHLWSQINLAFKGTARPTSHSSLAFAVADPELSDSEREPSSCFLRVCTHLAHAEMSWCCPGERGRTGRERGAH